MKWILRIHCRPCLGTNLLLLRLLIPTTIQSSGPRMMALILMGIIMDTGLHLHLLRTTLRIMIHTLTDNLHLVTLNKSCILLTRCIPISPLLMGVTQELITELHNLLVTVKLLLDSITEGHNTLNILMGMLTRTAMAMLIVKILTVLIQVIKTWNTWVYNLQQKCAICANPRRINRNNLCAEKFVRCAEQETTADV